MPGRRLQNSHEEPTHKQQNKVNRGRKTLRSGSLDPILPQPHPVYSRRSQHNRIFDKPISKNTQRKFEKHRRRWEHNKKIRQTSTPNVHNHASHKRLPTRTTICQPIDTYNHPDRGTIAPPPDSHQAYKTTTTKRVHKKGPAKNKEHEKHRQKPEQAFFDHTQKQCKTCPKTKKIMDPAKSTEKNTRTKTNLFLTLEKTVQDYIETQLKNRHNGHKLRELVSRCPCNTKHHISERYKYFKMIPEQLDHNIRNMAEQLDHNIRNMVNTKNDHSTPYNKTCLQNVKIRYQGGAESTDKGGCCETKDEVASAGCSEISPSLLPAHHPRSQSSQNKNTTEQQATKQQEENMPSDRSTAIREVQADILSTLKKTSYCTSPTKLLVLTSTLFTLMTSTA
jgi:hypothetical protein